LKSKTPPEERLPMPAISLVRRGILVALKWDFGAPCSWPREWTVSIRRRSPYLGPTFGLFDPAQDLRTALVDGLSPDFVFPSYCVNPAQFSCQVDDEWDVAALLRLKPQSRLGRDGCRRFRDKPVRP
jgi:hypothetical protein